MEEYVNKAVVVAEINRVLNSYDPNEITSGRYALVHLRDFLDTLEVKEVDLDAAVEDYIEQHKSELNGYMDIRRIARHFYVLGLNAQKGG